MALAAQGAGHKAPIPDPQTKRKNGGRKAGRLQLRPELEVCRAGRAREITGVSPRTGRRVTALLPWQCTTSTPGGYNTAPVAPARGRGPPIGRPATSEWGLAAYRRPRPEPPGLPPLLARIEPGVWAYCIAQKPDLYPGTGGGSLGLSLG